MDLKKQYTWLFHESKQLIFEPKKFWNTKQATTFTENIVVSLFIPMVILVGVAVLIGEIISNPEFLWSYAFMKAAREVVSYFLQFYVAVFVLAALLDNFGGHKNKSALQHVLAYSMLPFLVASFVTGLFPALYAFSITGLYGFYIFALGAKSSLGLPEENLSRYTILAILLIILIFGMINIISWKLLLAIFPYGA